jgi:hypothetical protein
MLTPNDLEKHISGLRRGVWRVKKGLKTHYATSREYDKGLRANGLQKSESQTE